MCGIAGQFNYRSGAPAVEVRLGQMCDLLAHRGPDGSGTWAAGPVGLGHRRLSIIDLSDAGRQPMSSPDGALVIVFNGEIYNFRELRRELAADGYTFRTKTDTEAILAAYDKYGPDCVRRLEGMFAFALWDARTRRLMLARDRAGKKPLYYWDHPNGLSFASEPKAFLADPAFPRRVNPEALAAYLALQYVPAPLSAFEEVHKLPPAHYALVDASGMTLTRYWRLPYVPKVRLSEADAVEGLREHLRAAVRKRLVSDVPLGAFLSGGIDSSLVVALMHEQGTERVKTFSIGFDEAEYNELAYARLVARRYETDHHEYIVRPNALEILPDLIWHYNEPFADSSAIPTYYLARLTRQHVTVALNGDAGDENFAGYDRYVANELAARVNRVPLRLRRTVAAGARLLPARGRGTLNRARRFLAALGESREQRYIRWLCHFDPGVMQSLCTREFLSTVTTDPVASLLKTYAETDAPDFIDATLDVDVQHYLPDDLLVKVDIATMAHSLEARAPFLDHGLMEFAARLPSSFKLRGTTKKYLLKQLARDYLPAEIIDRPKMGFGVPLEPWFREDLRELAHDVLLGPRARARGYFNLPFVEGLLRDHVAGRRSAHYQLWNLLVLELWHRDFIDARPARQRLSESNARSMGADGEGQAFIAR